MFHVVCIAFIGVHRLLSQNVHFSLVFQKDMESCGEDGEICVKLAPNLIEAEILVKMAPGNRSQNFIDEVFRAAQSKCLNTITV